MLILNYACSVSVVMFAIAEAPEDLDAAMRAKTLQEEVCELFTPLEHRFSGGQLKNKLFKYRLFEPKYDSQGKKYPLIVWMHGNGRLEIYGPENLGQLKWMDEVIFTTTNREEYPFFVLVLQCQEDMPTWFDRSKLSEENNDSPMTVLREIIQKTTQDYPVDIDKICLTGVSAGGSGAWEMAMRYPKLFAAIAPCAAAGGDESRAGQLKDTPVWAFHSEGDSPEKDRQMVAAVNRTGGSAVLTVVPGKGHNCWTQAFQSYNLLPWLLIQRRNEESLPPGILPWHYKVTNQLRYGKWKNYAGVLFAVILVVAAWSSERKRRRLLVLNQHREKDESSNDLMLEGNSE